MPIMNRCGLPFVLGSHSTGPPADSPRGTMTSSCDILFDSADNFSVGVVEKLSSSASSEGGTPFELVFCSTSLSIHSLSSIWMGDASSIEYERLSSDENSVASAL